MKKYFTLLILALPGICGFSQVCDPIDAGFGNGGKAFGLANAFEATNLIVQPDGKIIQAAKALKGNGYGGDFAVVRYNSNGSLDQAFGTNGNVITSFGQENDANAEAVILQEDGKIVVVGYAYLSGNSDFALVRYYSNGNLDSSFGNNGKVTTAAGPDNDYARSVALQPDGKIIVVGTTYKLDNSRCYNPFYFPASIVIRYNSNGSIDSSFGQNGKLIFNINQNFDNANAVALQPDGKILVAGTAYDNCSCDDYYGGLYCSSSFFVITRFNSNGNPDSSFGTNGRAFDPLLLFYPSSMLLQPDGKIVVTGSGSQNGFITERYNNNGSLDNSFGTGGKIITEVGGQNNSSSANSLTLQPDGKIVLAGTLYAGNAGYYFAVVRYKTDGSLDNAFNTNGTAVLHLGPPGSYDVATGVAMQGNKIIAGGNNGINQSGSIGVVRLRDTVPLLPAVIIAGGPVNFCEGGNVRLSINVSGSLQWYNNSVPVNGATDTIYTATTSGSYTVAVSNANGCAESAPLAVTVSNVPTPVIDWNGGLNFCQGDSIVLATNASGSLQWHNNGVLISGATGTTYTATNGSSYTVSVSKDGCSAVSDPVVVTVENILPKPVINRSGDLTFCQGGNVRLSSGASGSIQWYNNAVLIGGATDTVYTVITSGSYTAGASNTCGSIVSDPVVVTVNNSPPKPPIIWNSTYYFSTTSGYARYQWYLNDTTISGADSANYKPVQTGLYKVQVTNTANCSNRSDSFNIVILAVADLIVGDSRLRYYPNPVQTILNIDVPGIRSRKLEAELYDLTGRLLQKQYLNQTHNRFSVERLPAGLYQLVIQNGREKVAVKVMVIR